MSCIVLERTEATMYSMPSSPSFVARICETCGAEFSVPRHVVALGKGRFCSHPCRHAWMRTQRGAKANQWKGGISVVGRKCEWCGKTFAAKAGAVRKGHARFCSRYCGGQYRSDSAKEIAPSKIESVCEVCGKVFHRWPCSIENGEGRTCSRKCLGIYRSTQLIGEKSANWRGGPIEKQCEFCGKTMHAARGRMESGRGRFCSRDCYCRWYSANLSGENHWNWQGGSREYPPGWTAFLRREIRDRDDHRCAVCWISEEDNGRLLDVHHIDYDKENLHPDNLVSLCGSCHSKTNYNRDEWQGKFVAYTYSY